MGLRPPATAAKTELIYRLDAEWRVLSQSRWLRDRLGTWAIDDDRLAFSDGDQLIAAAQRRDAQTWAERDEILAALLERATGDVLGKRVALQGGASGFEEPDQRDPRVGCRGASRPGGGHGVGRHFLVRYRAGWNTTEFSYLREHEAPSSALSSPCSIGTCRIRRRLQAPRRQRPAHRRPLRRAGG